MDHSVMLGIRCMCPLGETSMLENRERDSEFLWVEIFQTNHRNTETLTCA